MPHHYRMAYTTQYKTRSSYEIVFFFLRLRLPAENMQHGLQRSPPKKQSRNNKTKRNQQQKKGEPTSLIFTAVNTLLLHFLREET